MNNHIDKEEQDTPKTNSNSNMQKITSKEIDIKIISKSFDESGDSGATVIFVGIVRNYSENGKVQGMNYESYIGMAEERIKKIEHSVQKMWDIKKINIIHRIGDLHVGDPSVVIAISTPHSKDAFEACQFILEKIKYNVPIWKKEKIIDGKTKWVIGKSIKSD
jgi:molybdopterin synthase catalytic subunit